MTEDHIYQSFLCKIEGHRFSCRLRVFLGDGLKKTGRDYKNAKPFIMNTLLQFTKISWKAIISLNKK